MKLKQSIKAIVVLMIFLMILTPTSSAWSWDTHADIADAVYYGLPAEVQKNLDLEIMENASNDPDEIFKDYTYHSYPKSYGKAKTWLDKGKTAYDQWNYAEASYDYGVATHYISDTFSAPHGVSKESSSDHSSYENRAKKLTPVATYKSGDLNTMMQNGYNQDGTSWNEWLQTKSSDIIQNNLNEAASVSLSAVKDSINFQPSSNQASSPQTSSLYDSILKLIQNTIDSIGAI
jgi:hypothetical protein